MKKILICEDEKDAQESIKNLLTKRNYDVYSVADGKGAIEKAQELKPDLVLLDIRLPKIDGLEVAKEIRSFLAGTKIIFVTAFQSPQIQQEAEKYDISGYIIKPTSGEEILKAIEKALV